MCPVLALGVSPAPVCGELHTLSVPVLLDVVVHFYTWPTCRTCLMPETGTFLPFS